jgi:hypothetical protein
LLDHIEVARRKESALKRLFGRYPGPTDVFTNAGLSGAITCVRSDGSMSRDWPQRSEAYLEVADVSPCWMSLCFSTAFASKMRLAYA